MSTELDDLRVSIDLLDSALVTILAERMRLVKKVGSYKKQHNIAPLMPERWISVLTSKKTLGESLGVSAELIEEIYTAIHENALNIEDQQG